MLAVFVMGDNLQGLVMAALLFHLGVIISTVIDVAAVLMSQLLAGIKTGFYSR